MTDNPDTLTLRPRGIGIFLAAGMLLALTVAFLVAAIVVHWLIWVLVLASACGAGVVVFAALPGRSFLRLEGEGFEIRTPFRRRRFAWDDVTPFVVAPLSYAELVVFRARSAPGADLPPTPEPTAKDVAKGAEALPHTYGHDAADLTKIMNEWRVRAQSGQPPAS